MRWPRAVEQQSEQRLGFTARRAAILAAVVCVLTLTIAGPVRTYFAQRTEMKQLAASEAAALRAQIADPRRRRPNWPIRCTSPRRPASGSGS